jgi:carboxylesterase type B
MVSPGLFHRAISQSGTAVSPFVISRSPVEQSKRLGKQLGCPTENSKEMVSCLKKVNAHTIAEVHHETSVSDFSGKIYIFTNLK